MVPQPKCLIVDSDPDHADQLAALCAHKGFGAVVKRLDTAAADEYAQLLRQDVDFDDFDVAFLDTTLGLPALSELADDALNGAEIFAMATADDSRLARSCVRAGISHYFCKPYSETNISAMLDDILAELETPVSQDSAVDSPGALDQFGLIRGSSKSMRKLFRLLRKIGPTDTTALIIGESGTGKELVAETLHALSERTDGPYLTLNCSALAENLIESELFGHEKGSFSGAHKRHIGFFERAHGGTLFLDEITEMQPDLQAKLLRSLESGEIRRVGAAEPQIVDVRVVAATNRDPLVAVEEGYLREDLYYRLANISVHVPPLRRRVGDIQGLALFFLMQLNEQHKTSLTISEDALSLLAQYEWPGNVRQLRHAIERAYIVSEGEIAESSFVLNEESPSSQPGENAIFVRLGATLAECERVIIESNLARNNGDKKATAAMLGISLKTLYNRLRDYDDTNEQLPTDTDQKSLR